MTRPDRGGIADRWRVCVSRDNKQTQITITRGDVAALIATVEAGRIVSAVGQHVGPWPPHVIQQIRRAM